MGGVIEIAGAMLSRAFERTETSAQNLSNLTTPGYKASRWMPSFPVEKQGVKAVKGEHSLSPIDFSAGKLKNTGRPLDLAIEGSGFFAVQTGDGTFYTRNGQFNRDEDGRLETTDGAQLLSDDGQTLSVKTSSPQILSDGTILDGGEPIGRIGIVDFSDKSQLQPVGGNLFKASGAADSENIQLRQGMLEMSNVSSADEMVTIMAALRSAESGQKLVQAYDDVLGRALDVFGQS
jgi:flagellar basal-body rod protein FlgG